MIKLILNFKNSLTLIRKFIKYTFVNLKVFISFLLSPFLFLKFIIDIYHFKNLGGSISKYYPIITDKSLSASNYKGHYFHKDLLVASLIHKKKILFLILT